MVQASSPFLELAKTAAWLLGGVLLGTTLVVSADVWLAIGGMDPRDPSTMPNMGPPVRLLFIPMLSFIVLLFAGVADAAIQLLTRRVPLRLGWEFMALGASYSLLLIGLPLRYLLPSWLPVFLMGPALAVLCAFVLRKGRSNAAVRHES